MSFTTKTTGFPRRGGGHGFTIYTYLETDENDTRFIQLREKLCGRISSRMLIKGADDNWIVKDNTGDAIAHCNQGEYTMKSAGGIALTFDVNEGGPNAMPVLGTFANHLQKNSKPPLKELINLVYPSLGACANELDLPEECNADDPAALCEKLWPWQRADCYYAAARLFDDSTLCKKTSRSDECLFELKRDTGEALCEGDLGHIKDVCYNWLAEYRKDPEMCYKMSRSADECHDRILIKRGMEKKDTSVCMQMREDYTINACYRDLKSLLKPSTCGEIQDEDYNFHRDTCWYYVALASKNTSLCDRITDETIKEICLGTRGYDPSAFLIR